MWGSFQISRSCVATARSLTVDTMPCFGGPTRKVRLFKMYQHYKEWCKANGVEQPVKQWQCKHFQPREGVVFWTQRTAKAAQMKPFIFWLRDLCEQQNSNEHQNVRCTMYTALVVFETTCADHGRFLTLEAVQAVETSAEVALNCMGWLHKHSDRAAGLYHVVPKGHMMTHLAYDSAAKTNPRRCQCYSDEDLMGKVKRILTHCHGSSASIRALSRYKIWICLRWWIQLHKLRGIPLTG